MPAERAADQKISGKQAFIVIGSAIAIPVVMALLLTGNESARQIGQALMLVGLPLLLGFALVKTRPKDGQSDETGR